MTSTRSLILGVVLVVVAAIAVSSMFTVHQTQLALVTKLGEPVRVQTDPGLKFKVPLIEDVIYYDARVLDLDPQGQEVPLSDQKRIIVDSYARYRIVDPLKFYQTVRTEGTLRNRFGGLLNSAVRDALGQTSLADLLSEKRTEVMDRITEAVSANADDFGIEVVDVRIGRTDLPEQTEQAVYNRMRSDRVAQAAEIRAEGAEIKEKIQAAADRERTVIIADARRQSDILRGQGEAQSRDVLNTAHGADPEFYAFYRSMEAYRASLSEGTTMVLSPDSAFFRYFGQPNASK